jgi:hypothetical protein
LIWSQRVPGSIIVSFICFKINILEALLFTKEIKNDVISASKVY